MHINTLVHAATRYCIQYTRNTHTHCCNKILFQNEQFISVHYVHSYCCNMSDLATSQIMSEQSYLSVWMECLPTIRLFHNLKTSIVRVATVPDCMHLAIPAINKGYKKGRLWRLKKASGILKLQNVSAASDLKDWSSQPPPTPLHLEAYFCIYFLPHHAAYFCILPTM